jgi:hypothetical protein
MPIPVSRVIPDIKSMNFRFGRISFLSIVYFLLFICLRTSAQEGTSSRPPLALVVLLDASASMQKTDPTKIWQAATEAILLQLSSADRVAIVEFGTNARLHDLGGDPPWISASQSAEWLKSLKKVGDTDLYTDFRVALQKSLLPFERLDGGNFRKVVLIMSDGKLEPNLDDETYHPNTFQSGSAAFIPGGKSRKAIVAEYKLKAPETARYLIERDILPQFGRLGIEIFAVSLGGYADPKLLTRFAEATSKHPEEVHAFHARNATELVGIFSRLLPYWTDRVPLVTKNGEIVGGSEESIFLDKYISDPMIFYLLNGRGDLRVRSEDGISEEVIQGLSPSLLIAPIRQAPLPATLRFGFASGSGEFTMICTGRSLLKIEVSGLKHEYRFGEALNADVRLLESGNSTALVSSGRAGIEGKLHKSDASFATDLKLPQIGDHFKLETTPATSGVYGLNLFARARDEQGREILPRPSVDYQFEVLPSLYVKPDRLVVGDVLRGDTAQVKISFHSGLSSPVVVKYSSQITIPEPETGTRTTDFPHVESGQVTIRPLDSTSYLLVFAVPDQAGSGYYEGVIQFTHSEGRPAEVVFTMHVPNFWDRFGWFVIVIAAILLAVLAYFVWIWGLQEAPSGVLRLLDTTEMPNAYALGKLRRGFFRRYFHWRRNRIEIAQNHAEIRLKSLPGGMRIELIFYRPGKVMLKNISNEKSNLTIVVEKPGLGKYPPRGIGESLRIGHNTLIDLGTVKLKYEKVSRR